MNNITFIESLLSKGLFLKVFFINKNNKYNFAYLLNSNFINKMKIYDKKFNKNKIIHICLDKNFSFKNKNIYSIEYISPPDNLDILKLDDLNLFDDEKYLNKILNEIINIKIIFKNYLLSYKLNVEDIKQNKNKNKIILSTFPYHEHYLTNLSNFKKFKNKIIKKFFEKNITHQFQNEDCLDSKLLETFNYLDIDIKNKNVNDSVFIDALRNEWNSIIEEHKIKLYNDLNSEYFLSNIPEDEKQEFLDELALFKNELNKDDMENLKEFKTIKEIISYWPSILTPTPFFVYDEY